MVEELRTIWNKVEYVMFVDDVAGILERYFGKRTE